MGELEFKLKFVQPGNFCNVYYHEFLLYSSSYVTVKWFNYYTLLAFVEHFISPRSSFKVLSWIKLFNSEKKICRYCGTILRYWGIILIAHRECYLVSQRWRIKEWISIYSSAGVSLKGIIHQPELMPFLGYVYNPLQFLDPEWSISLFFFYIYSVLQNICYG